MLKNYFKVSLRNLTKNKVSAFINIGGLAVGMGIAMLISLWIYDELSFNKYHKNYNRIARVMQQETWFGERGTNMSQPMPLATELHSSFAGDFEYVVLSSQTWEHIIASGDKKFMQPGKYMQADAPEMLTLKMLYGSRSGLKNLNSILLSESLAKKLFGDSDPMDKLVKIDNKLDAKVTGVYEDLPNNSEFKDVTFIAPWDLFISSDKRLESLKDNWTNSFSHIYTQIAVNTDFEKVSAKIKNVKLDHVDKEFAAHKPVVFLQPMNKWHLHSKYENGVNVTSEQMQFVWLYGIIGAFVLLLACINFMNLSTARSEKRAKEVGIRKAIGSVRGQLISQFYSESLLTAGFAFVLSIGIVQILLPWFNEVADKEIQIVWANPMFWLAGIVYTFVTGLLAGSYPALYLSSFNPVKVLKGAFRVGRYASIPRKVLVVVQFTISITLIISTIIVYRQIQFAKNRPVGYSRDGLIAITMSTPELYKNYDVLRNDLISTGAITEISRSSGPITDIWSTSSGFDWKGKDPSLQTNFITCAVTHDYGKTIGWEFINGRDFSTKYSTDSIAIVLNETAVKLMGLKNPINEPVTWEGRNFKVIGVVKDLVMASPFEPVRPTVFFIDYSWAGIINIRINPVLNVGVALSRIREVFQKHNPGSPFDYKFADLEYAKKFDAEERIGKLASFFAILAILISCLGLFGLASFVAEQRTKEIGVRKVLGASITNLWQMMSKEFVRLVLISCLIAFPIAYYFLHEWLQKYEYRTEISWWIFAAAAIGAFLITLLTVSFQAIKAAMMNPVKSLRTE